MPRPPLAEKLPAYLNRKPEADTIRNGNWGKLGTLPTFRSLMRITRRREHVRLPFPPRCSGDSADCVLRRTREATFVRQGPAPVGPGRRAGQRMSFTPEHQLAAGAHLHGREHKRIWAGRAGSRQAQRKAVSPRQQMDADPWVGVRLQTRHERANGRLPTHDWRGYVGSNIPGGSPAAPVRGWSDKHPRSCIYSWLVAVTVIPIGNAIRRGVPAVDAAVGRVVVAFPRR